MGGGQRGKKKTTICNVLNNKNKNKLKKFVERGLEGLGGDNLAVVGICEELRGPAPGGHSVLTYLGGVTPWRLLRDPPRQASLLGAMRPPSAGSACSPAAGPWLAPLG